VSLRLNALYASSASSIRAASPSIFAIRVFNLFPLPPIHQKDGRPIGYFRRLYSPLSTLAPVPWPRPLREAPMRPQAVRLCQTVSHQDSLIFLAEVLCMVPKGGTTDTGIFSVEP
jgi:hypothetical protein